MKALIRYVITIFHCGNTFPIKYGENKSGNFSPQRESMTRVENGKVCNIIESLDGLVHQI